MDQVEATVAEILSSILGLPLSRFESSLSLSSLGESLLSEAIEEIEIEFNINIPDFEFQSFKTFGDLVEYVVGKI